MIKPKVNVLVDGVGQVPSRIRSRYDLAELKLRLMLHDKRGNITFSFDDIEGATGRTLRPLVRDLLDIAAVIFVCDQFFPRDKNQFREVSILIPVSNPRLWRDLRNELQRAVCFLTQDSFDFHFVKNNALPSGNVPSETRTKASCVSLLSGGLDSFAGAQDLIENGENPIFVSHYTKGKSHASQNKLLDFLKRKYKKDFRLCRVMVSKQKGQEPLSLLKTPAEQVAVQFSRSFLFLSLATAVAVELGLQRVYIFENGPIAINAAISESRINTRTAHPQFLQLYQDFVSHLFGVKLGITNPYLYRTKSEVVGDIISKASRSAVKIAVSCWQTGRVGIRAIEKGLAKGEFKGHHCGLCFPCILRRIANSSVGLKPQQDDKYLWDVLVDYPAFGASTEETITTIADLLRFCYDLRTLSDDEVFGKYPDLSISADSVDLGKVLDTYRRHANQVVKCFRSLGNDLIQKKFLPLLV